MKILYVILPLLLNLLSCKNKIILLDKEKDDTRIEIIQEAIQDENINFLDSLTNEEINKIVEVSDLKVGLNPFHISLLFGSKKIIKMFLNKGANPNIITTQQNNWMDLFFIRRKDIAKFKDEKNEDKIEIINSVLENDALVISNLKEKGKNLLHYLAFYTDFTKKQYESILSHIKEKIDFNTIYILNNLRYTPLYAAVSKDNIVFARILFKNNASQAPYSIKELEDTHGEELEYKFLLTPIFCSILMTKASIFDLFLENKANIEYLEEKFLKKILILALKTKIKNEDEEIYILKKIFKIKKLPKEDLSKMFLEALVRGKNKIAHYLLNTFNEIDVNIGKISEENLIKEGGYLEKLKKKKKTALCYAVRNCNLEIVKELVRRGAIIEDKKNEQMSPLIFILKGAIISEHSVEDLLSIYNEEKAIEILKFLKEKGINLNKKLSQDLNLLESAIKTNCQKIAKYLLDQGMEIPNFYPLRCSTSYTDTIIYDQDELFIEIFEKFKKQSLLKKGNLNEAFKIIIKENKEINLLNLAAQTSNERIFEYLINKGANPFDKNIHEVSLYFGTPIEEINNTDSLEEYIKSIKIEKNLDSLSLAMKNTNIKIFDLILTKGKEKDLAENKEKIVSFIKNNLTFGKKTFIHNVKEGLFGVLKFILINIENEFKDLQPYINYSQQDETALDILHSFFKEEKEIIELFKKNSAFKFNEIKEIEKDRKKRESLVYLILNNILEEALIKIDKEPYSIYEANEDNITPLIASIISVSKNKDNNLSRISYNLFKKILENIKEKQEINRVDINKKNALIYLLETENINTQILEELILKGANINFRYGRKYHIIIDLINNQKEFEEKEILINIFKKSKEGIFLTKKDLAKISKIYYSSEKKDLFLKTLNGIVRIEDLAYQNFQLKSKISKELKIVETRKTSRFKKNFEKTSIENRAIIKEQLDNLKNKFKIDVKLLEGLDTKVYEIRKDRIRIFYFINNSTLYLIDLEDNKHQDSLPNAYYRNLALLKKQIISDINFNQKEKYEKFE